MVAARNVYLLIFFLLVFPSVFYPLRKRRQYTDKKKRTSFLALIGALILFWAVACALLYTYTINRQVLIVAERGAIALYDDGRSGNEPGQSLLEEGIADNALSIEGTPDGGWASFKGAKVLIPEKMLTLNEEKWYPVVLQNQDGQRLLLAMDIVEGVPKSIIRRVRIFWPDEIGDRLDRITFFTADTL